MVQGTPLCGTVVLTLSATNTSSNAFGGGHLHAGVDPFEAGGDFLAVWSPRHFNTQDGSALYELLRQFCAVHPNYIRREQVGLDVGNQSVVRAFRRGRVKYPRSYATPGS